LGELRAFLTERLNRKFYLKRRGEISIGEDRYLDIQLYPDIEIKAQGDPRGLRVEI